ncbi:heparan-alpha-glucosaminide N-acetyltransferase domain-containing protein [Methylomonas sp. AM2-LC]|uniref:heparan-alpha-glucosaminide N-acetyltransferase domain-containing protein n=1 Tax=Methylomonas sp. AM2-LC TaxID=3153301 RepID=UPI003266BDE5
MNAINKAQLGCDELDVLRGLAALFMIVNHAGYNLVEPELYSHSIFDLVLVVSSYAPVLFFFATGVGAGIQSTYKLKNFNWYPVLYKTAVLLLADWLGFWSLGIAWGIDFLGFIAISGVVLEFIRCSKNPIISCLVGILTFSLFRYAIGPHLDPVTENNFITNLQHWVFGNIGVQGATYPLSPWMVYPLWGYIVGFYIMHYRPIIETHKVKLIVTLICLALLPAVLSIVAERRGFSFIRWGTVGVGFYIRSFAVVLLSLAFVWIISALSSLTAIKHALSLRGTSSLAVVPIHYYIIYLVSLVFVEKDLNTFFPLILVILALSFWLAKGTNSLGNMMRQSLNPQVGTIGLMVLYIPVAFLTFYYGFQASSLSIEYKTLGQLLLSLLFVLRKP